MTGHEQDYTRETHLRLLERQEKQIESRLLSASTAERRALERRLGVIREMRHDPDASFADMRRALARRSAALTRLHNEIDPDRFSDAQNALRAGDGRPANDIFAELEAAQQPAIDRAADAAYQRAMFARDGMAFEEARDHLERALRLRPGDYDALRDLAQISARLGDMESRIRCEEEALQAAEEKHGPESPETAQALDYIAKTAHQQGRLDAAEEAYNRALAIDSGLLGDDHPDIAARLNNLANLQRDMGRWEDAERNLKRALEIGESVLGSDHPEYAIWLNNLAGLYRGMGRPADAEPLLIRALDITRDALGERHPSTAIRLNNLAGLRRLMGRLNEAESLYRKAIDIDAEALGRDHPGYAVDLNNLALLYETMGRERDAEDLFASALRIFSARLGPRHPTTKQAAQSVERCRSRASRQGGEGRATRRPPFARPRSQWGGWGRRGVQ